MRALSTRRRALALLGPELPWLLVAFACMGVLTLATTAAADLVGPVLRTLVTGGVGEGLWGRWLSPRRLEQARWLLPSALLGLGLIKGVAYFGQFHLMGMAGQRVASALRRRFVAALVEAGPAFLLTQRTGDLLSRLSGDVAAVELAVTYAVAAYVRDTLTALALFSLCVALDWRLSLLAFGFVPLTLAPLRRVARRLLAISRQTQSGQGHLGHRLAEGLQGLRQIQVDGLEASERERFARQSRETCGQLERAVRLRAAASPLMEIVAVAGLAAMLWIASAEVARGEISPEHLVSFLAAALLLAQPLKSLGKVGQFAVTGLAAAERLFEIEDAARHSGTAAGDSNVALALEEKLELRDVWFRYPSRDGEEPRWALRGLDLEVRKGERLGLVGESGSGKSTAVALLLGVHQPERGSILLDGVDLRSVPLESRRRLLAWVGQDAFLLDLSLGENISLSEGDSSPARLRDAARQAGALELIERAGGFAAPVGERGGRLSGGERQRIGLARAFYRDAPLLLLDEPTSQLDAESEEEISKTLEKLLSGRTALVVSHRLATIRGCDRVVVLDQGRAVEAGPPRLLADGSGPFAVLMASQLGGAARAAG